MAGQPEAQLGLGGGDIQTLDIVNGISIGFDVDAFDEIVHAHGIAFTHHRGMRNPVGMIDKFDSRRPDADHSGASNGLLYTPAGTVTAAFTNNSKSLRQAENGVLDAATAQLTTPRYYDNSKEPIYLHPMDRLYLKEESILVTHQQLVESSVTGSDRLRFLAVGVLDLVDSAGIRYKAPDDFVVESGLVKWTGRRPGIDPASGKGRIYAIRFTYKPYWYVDRLLHEVRMAQIEDPATGERKTMRMPQCAIIQREYVFHNESNDDQAPDPKSPRQAPGPSEGGFGPR